MKTELYSKTEWKTL